MPLTSHLSLRPSGPAPDRIRSLSCHSRC